MKKEKGFTLVEMLVVMVILSIVLVIIGKFITVQSSTLRKQQMIANTQQNLRVAAEIMTRDLEMACLNPMGVPGDTFAFRVFQPGRTEFTMDLDGDGRVTPKIDTLPRQDEYRGFYLAGDTLRRARVPGGGVPPLASEDIATGIDTLAFTYYDKDSTVVIGASYGGRIARVRFLITARSAGPYLVQDTTKHIRRRTSSWVVVRNRGF
jgi:prepilin-type N-terminal cleavage/methylation domain-containing protein